MTNTVLSNLITFFVSKLDKFKDTNDEQLENIFVMLLIFDVLKLYKSIELKFEHL